MSLSPRFSVTAFALLAQNQGPEGRIPWIIIALLVGLVLVGILMAIVVAIITVVARSGKKNPNLLPCPMCNQRVSPAAVSCPNCGHPLKPESSA